MDNSRVEALKRSFGGTMTDEQRESLRDLQAFIDFSVENGISFLAAVSTIAHDVNGMLTHQDANWFQPKTKGYSKIVADLGRKMDALAADPEHAK